MFDLNELVNRVVDGRYRVDGMLAFGGMGAVFRANHMALGYDVALKVLHPQLSEDQATCKRFEREAYSASLLNHPNCVKVHDYGSTLDGITYMAMELLEGGELKSILGQPMPPLVAVERMLQILEALAHAHENGVIHRDLKPANVYVTRDSRGYEILKLVDFGIAKVLTDRKVQEKLTQTGIVYGTPHYMSPEQCTGGEADARSDLYAAGLIFYRMLAGRPPFRAEDGGTLMRMQVMSPPDPLPGETPRVLAHVVERLLEKDPAKRYANAREVIDRLERMRPLLHNVPAAAVGPVPAAASLVAPQPVPAQPSKKEGDTAPLGAGSWQQAAGSSMSNPSASMSSSSGPSLLPWFLAAAGLGLGLAAIGLMVWQRMDYQSDLAELQARVDQIDNPAATVPVEPETEPAEVEAEAAPVVVAAAPVDPSAADAERVPPVKVLIRTNVPAQILDAADFGSYGSTNGAEGVEMERSGEPVALILRAEGHADHEIAVVPDDDKSIDVELVPAPRGKKARRGVARKTEAGAPEPDVQKPTSGSKKPKSIDESKLVDPWGN